MVSLGSFFEKFLKLNRESDFEKSKILEVFKNISNINLDNKQFNFKDKSIFLNCSPLIRGELMMKKEKIIKELATLNIEVKNIK